MLGKGRVCVDRGEREKVKERKRGGTEEEREWIERDRARERK